MTTLRTSNHTVAEWLDATAHNITPTGERTEVVRVPHEWMVDVPFGDDQASYCGSVQYQYNINPMCARYRMRSPSIVNSATMVIDRKSRTTYVCASDADIARIRAELAEIRAEEALNADMGPLQDQWVEKLRLRAQHERDWHHAGRCTAGTNSVRMHDTFDLETELMAFEGSVNEALLYRMSPQVARAMRRLASLPEGGRNWFLTTVQLAVSTQERVERRAFAAGVLQELLRMGFRRPIAQNIIRESGPGNALAAVRYALDAWNAVKDPRPKVKTDVLDVVLGGARGTAKFGYDRQVDVLTGLGLPVPICTTAKALFGIMKGAHIVVLTGLPAPLLSAGLLDEATSGDKIDQSTEKQADEPADQRDDKPADPESANTASGLLDPLKDDHGSDDSVAWSE